MAVAVRIPRTPVADVALVPKACLEPNPSRQSIFFSGAYINMHAIHRAQDLDMALLSNVFSGRRMPTLNTATKVSAALGMGLEAFLEALEIRRALIRDAQTRLKLAHEARIRREDADDLRTARAGRPVAPRTPGLRA